MKFWKVLLVVLVVSLNFAIAKPSLADAGKFMKSSEYTEVTQAISDLKNPEKTADMAPEEIQQKLADLRFQKYILETSESRSTCRNETGATLAIYAKPKKTKAAPTLYYLGAGETTDDDVECVGIYQPGTTEVLPDGTQQQVTEAIALKFVPGTQLIATTNPNTGAIEFNTPAFGMVTASEGTWSIPTLTQAEIEAQVSNAPVD